MKKMLLFTTLSVICTFANSQLMWSSLPQNIETALNQKIKIFENEIKSIVVAKNKNNVTISCSKQEILSTAQYSLGEQADRNCRRAIFPPL